MTNALSRNRFDIEITERDIANGIREDSTKCVVAQAIARTIPDAMRIDVDTQSLRFTYFDQRLVYLTPPAVSEYVVAFDAGDPIEPFRFHLRNPVRVKRALRTDAGKARHREYDREMRAAIRDAQPSESRAAALQRAAVRRAAAPPNAAAGNELPTLIPDRGMRRAPPRVFKTKQRRYGHRVLRWNRERSAEAE